MSKDTTSGRGKKMREVKKFYVTNYETVGVNGRRGEILVVKASDYAALEAECAEIRKERDTLRQQLAKVKP